jgi:hypothetical protein
MAQGSVTLFSDRQFAGSSVPLDEGETRFPADFNDSASSVRVASGYCAVLYEHANEVRWLWSFGRSPRRLPRSFGVRLRQENVVRARLSSGA